MSVALLLGIAGPAIAVSGSWALMVRTARRDPAQLTPVMAAAFGAKMVFFAGYVAFALRVVSVPAAPFIVSFAAAFVALYVVEAVGLSRLLSNR
jgi:hypothetical protein